MKLFTTYLFAFLTAVFSCLSPAAWAEEGEQRNFELHAKVNGLLQREVYLLQLYGSKKTFVDSASVDEQGGFAFIIPNVTQSKEGVYSVILGQSAKAKTNDDAPQSFDIIVTPGKTILTTSFINPVDSMKVVTGPENQHYYAYLAMKVSSTQKLQILEKVLQIYPDDCSAKSNVQCFYKTLEKQYNGVQQELLSYTNGLVKKYPKAFFPKIALAEQYPLLDAAASGDKRSATLKEKFFKAGDFRDTLLLHSDVLTGKIMAYLGLYINKQYTGDQQVNEFIKAIDRLLPIAKAGDEKIYQYTLDYLLEGFNLVKADAVVAYITDHYLAESSCGIDDERIKEIVKKSEDYKRTAIGATAPEITFAAPVVPQQVNEPKNLSDIHSSYTLLLFWASWCPHCTQLLPEVAKVYDEYKGRGLEILAVSLDVDSVKWRNTITSGNYTWLNYTDLKSWQSPAAQSYNVIATPTMFLLDKDKKIIAKPSTAQDLIHSISTKQ